MKHEDILTVATLTWCNDRRTERDLEPLADLPQGTREDPTSCPCGKATGLHVDTDYYAEVDENGDVLDDTRSDLPLDVSNFVRSFDDGEYPQYDEKESLING